ncbi:TetR/AcrR family transcriptional regulator [Exiguobacterium aurantiacum]|uniref:TetR/AcrR family transcriptional regulator n=1 Tax=Exiguobacterium aurantiacum TaxID=33987 RepID=A0ABY5FNJ4_9BACL|nr:TetR/AcrR family transcriptional regulator [Exiguobacterium aurantiacum]UTT42884.1 TetR/AcrR family transcriptional regulator [Exiguobacterium aurantiacum]
MSKRQQNKEERLNRIISQAEILFLKDGFERVQMQDIADAAEIGVATLFRYFPKKDQLIVAAAVRNLAPTLDAFKELTSRSGDAYSRLEAILDYLLDQQMKRTSHSRFREAFESYASFVPSPLPGIDDYIGLQREIMETLEPLIEAGKTDGSLRSDIDVKTTVVTVINAFGTFGNNIILKSHISYLEDDIEPHIQQRVLREMLLSYVRP